MKKSLMIGIIVIMILGIFGVSVNAASASISASPKTVNLNNTVTVTVSFGEKVSAAQFTLNYDSSALEYLSKSGAGLFNASTKKYGYNSEDGITADLSSVSFTFRAKKTGTVNVSVNGLKISNATQTGISATMGNSNIGITVKEAQTNNGGSSSNKGNSSSNKNNSNKNNSNKTNNTQTNETTEGETTENEPIDGTSQSIIKLDDENVTTLQNSSTNVMVKALPNVIEEGAVLSVSNINEYSSEYRRLEDILKNIKGKKIYFDINLLKDNLAIQPNGYVTVCIPIPEGYNKENIQVYRINKETGEYELQEGIVQGDYFTFSTNKLDTYALVEGTEPSETTGITDETNKTEKKTILETITDFFSDVRVLYGIILILSIVVIVQALVIASRPKRKSNH